MLQGMYGCPSDTVGLISQLQDDMRSRGEEEQRSATYRWRGCLLNSGEAQTDLDKRSGARYLREHRSGCKILGKPGDLLVAFELICWQIRMR